MAVIADFAAARRARDALKAAREAADAYFAASGLPMFDPDPDSDAPPDPAIEVDVYIVYGRREPALALIERALAAQPEREDLRLYREAAQAMRET